MCCLCGKLIWIQKLLVRFPPRTNDLKFTGKLSELALESVIIPNNVVLVYLDIFKMVLKCLSLI